MYFMFTIQPFEIIFCTDENKMFNFASHLWLFKSKTHKHAKDYYLFLYSVAQIHQPASQHFSSLSKNQTQLIVTTVRSPVKKRVLVLFEHACIKQSANEVLVGSKKLSLLQNCLMLLISPILYLAKIRPGSWQSVHYLHAHICMHVFTCCLHSMFAPFFCQFLLLA